MKQFGDEKQFGPLLIAAGLQNLENRFARIPMGIRRDWLDRSRR